MRFRRAVLVLRQFLFIDTSMMFKLGVVGCGEGVMYLCHWGVQLILAYRWARPAILVAGKGRGGMF